MGPSNLRLAAGVGVVAVAVIVGGPTAAVAMADPGGSHGNHSGHGDRGGWKPGGGDRDGGGSGDDRDGGSARDRSGGNDRWGDGGGSDGQKSSSGSGSNNRSTSSSSSSNGSSTSSLVPQATTGGSQSSSGASASQTPADGPGSDTVNGAEVASPPTPMPVEPPRVVFGNGRNPGIQPHVPEPSRPYFILPEIPPPPPSIPGPSAPTDRVHPQRLIPPLGIAPSLNWTDPLWGLAGLIVIPAAGAVLGYRQAKAARAAEVLTRT